MDCPQTSLATKPELSRYVYYKLLALIPVSAALIAIVRYSDAWYWPFVYIGLCLGHAAIMFTIKCPHCPYYRMGNRTLRCFMWWGMPKIYKARARPERKLVGVYAPAGMLVLTLFPVYWLRFDWALLSLFLLSVAVIVMSIGQNECPRCLNFDCPHNLVPESVKKQHADSLTKAA